MEALFASGRIIDVILVLVVVEAAAIFVYRRITHRGPSLRKLLPNLFSGFFLLLALRAALLAASWWIIAAMLTGALIAHVLDLLRAWGDPPPVGLDQVARGAGEHQPDLE